MLLPLAYAEPAVLGESSGFVHLALWEVAGQLCEQVHCSLSPTQCRQCKKHCMPPSERLHSFSHPHKARRPAQWRQWRLGRCGGCKL